jgi:hypothetical protein
MLPGLYEVLVILVIFGAGSLVLVLPVIYAVFAIKERRRILSEIEGLRQDVRRLRPGPEARTGAE